MNKLITLLLLSGLPTRPLRIFPVADLEPLRQEAAGPEVMIPATYLGAETRAARNHFRSFK